MTQEDNARRLEQLLIDAGAAHHVYETDVLKGVRDEAWAGWYARYLVEHGVADLLERAVAPEGIGSELAEYAAAHAAEGSAEAWAAYYARRLQEAHGG